MAERARISAQSVSALERGARHAPRPDTLALLVKTLGLAGDERDDFERAARASVKRRVRHGPESIAARAGTGSPWTGPLFADAFFGRERERATLAAALRKGHCTTVWGMGGVGKTRLVVELLRDPAFDAGDRIVFVPLAAAIGDAAVVPAVAEAIGSADASSQELTSAVIAALGERRTILVLDNCEHVVTGVSAFVEALLARSPVVTVACTSREPLRIASERVVKVGPLALSDSAQLFVDRSRLAREGGLSSADDAAIATICRRLDHLPLAVELAAARVSSLGLASIERELDERFALLTRGRRSDAARLQTLRATIGWSYALLSYVERVVFERVALLNGRFSLEEAIAICVDEEIERWDVVDAIADLIEKAMLSVIETDEDDERPYLLLESTRAFALDLGPHERADGNPDASQRRFGDYLLRLVRVDRWPYLHESDSAFEGIDADIVRGFLHWAIDDGNAVELGALITGFLRNFWDVRGLYAEGLRWGASALERLPKGADDVEPRVAALRCVGLIHSRLGRWFETFEALEEAYSLTRHCDNATLHLWTTVALAKSARMVSIGLARERAREATQLFHDLGDPSGLPAILSMEAVLALQSNDVKRARDIFKEMLARLEEAGGGFGHRRLREQTKIDLAEAEYVLGNFAAAATLGRENAESIGEDNLTVLQLTLNNLCVYLACNGDLDEAACHARRVLPIARRTGNNLIVAITGQACAMIAVRRGVGLRSAAEIFGWAAHEFRADEFDLGDRMTQDRLGAMLSEAMPPDELDAARNRGALLSPTDVADLALSLVDRSGATAP